MILLAAIISAGYLLGSIPVGYLLGRCKGVDIRKLGSGNIGATNVFRTLGKKAGIFVFVCDLFKGVLGVLLGYLLCRHIPFQDKVINIQDSIIHIIKFMQPVVAGIVGGVAAIIGHNFPVWLKFKGGKGVATSLGVVFGLTPLPAAAAFAVWTVVLFATGYVSLASIIGALTVPVLVALTARADEKTPLLCFTCLAALLIVLRHRENIKRLLNGTENRFKKPKENKP